MRSKTVLSLSAALLLGVGTFLHVPTVHAQPPCATCEAWLTACEQGNQYDCMLHHNLCSAVCRAMGGIPSIKNNGNGKALLNPKQVFPASK